MSTALMELLLDHNKTYQTKDRLEIWWKFTYEKPSGIPAHWHAYKREPGNDKFVSRGAWEQRDIYHFLKDNNTRFSPDDRISFGLWMSKGGLEDLFSSFHAEETQPLD